ncbi:MAG: hypothetical protein M3R06_02200 [Chloroflexota bacterium]|nr:hypothetical protein [Chloroflexota bacterium]
MVLTEEQLEQTELQVLSVLESSVSPYPPLQLIDRLKKDKMIPESLIRAAIWYLIDRNEVELTPDRRLRRLGRPPLDGVMEGADSG